MALSLSRRLVVCALLASGSFSVCSPSARAFELVEQGKLTVAFTGDIPGSGWQDGKMIGYDGEIMQKIADRLGLKFQPALMEWSGTIASVESDRVDVMLRHDGLDGKAHQDHDAF
jgi:L-cystine transport system substrate-binding protein